jgi:hypothetical protein
MEVSEGNFYTRHGLAETAGIRAFHCINCDHECPTTAQKKAVIVG